MKATVTVLGVKGFLGRHVATKVNEKKVVVESVFVTTGDPAVLDFDELTLAWAKADKGLRVSAAPAEAPAEIPSPTPKAPAAPAKRP